VIFELTWHGPVCDVPFSVEADTEEDAMHEVARALNENDEKWLRSHEAEEKIEVSEEIGKRRGA
jgi:hypothetical protein